MGPPERLVITSRGGRIHLGVCRHALFLSVYHVSYIIGCTCIDGQCKCLVEIDTKKTKRSNHLL